MSNTMEDFPALPVTEKKFEFRQASESTCRSSASTTSVGAREPELRYKLSLGDNYMIMDTFDLRPSLYCWCENCNQQYPTAENFGDCKRASNFVHSEFRCSVTDSKVIGKRSGKFSVSYVKTNVEIINEKGEVEMRTLPDGTEKPKFLHGWVKSKFLRTAVRASKSVEPEFRYHSEVDRSRSPSVFLDSCFRFGDLVLVRDQRNNWVRGEVRQERPLLILVEGKSMPEPFHISNIKDHPTREFLTTKDLSVRRNKFRGDWSPETVKAGTRVKVAYMDGFEGRIVAPFQGWVTMRDTHYSALNVVESNWTLTTRDVIPTMIVTNLPNSLTEASLRTHLATKCFVNPKDIIFQRKGDKFRAVVTSVGSFKSVSVAVKKQTSELHHGWSLSMKWDMTYLKNHALMVLNKKQTKV